GLNGQILMGMDGQLLAQGRSSPYLLYAPVNEISFKSKQPGMSLHHFERWHLLIARNYRYYVLSGKSASCCCHMMPATKHRRYQHHY
ncbi:hypothetical protein, partial [Enterobacter hormaechei]